METPAKPLRGIEIVRKLLEVKKQAQRETIDNYRNNPEVRADFDRLMQRNKQRRAGEGAN
ncbi:MAG: hypothetical protein EAZ91_01450 [Cytophagales bacterium]|nr:MAG: hypothetical protein EAZ91_01450 [Cytophagales bacterium]